MNQTAGQTGQTAGQTVSKFVVYYRVSTKGQGESGLGLEAQQRDVALYLERYSRQPFEIVETVTDVRSGAGMLADRPALAAAVAVAEREGAALLVAKLDRLSRDMELIAHLIKRVELVVACMPQADKSQLYIYGMLAEMERDFISARTKAALAQAKARGVKLGGVRPGTQARNEGARLKAMEDAERCRAALAAVAGKSLREQAAHLNAMGIPTARGGDWTATQVMRVRDRLAETGAS